MHGACDFVYHRLHSNGIGVCVHHTPLITVEEEDKLWEYGIIGIDNAKALQ